MTDKVKQYIHVRECCIRELEGEIKKYEEKIEKAQMKLQEEKLRLYKAKMTGIIY